MKQILFIFVTIFIFFNYSFAQVKKNKKHQQKAKVTQVVTPAPIVTYTITYRVKWNELKAYGETVIVEQQQIICNSYQYTQVNLVLYLQDNTRLYINKSQVVSVEEIKTQN